MSDNKRKFRLWPEPEEGKTYGPTAKQRLLFIEDLPNEDTYIDDVNLKRPHHHPLDILLYIGGAR